LRKRSLKAPQGDAEDSNAKRKKKAKQH
jgi:hypothetical protein